MRKPALSICLEDLRLDVKAAMERARSLGFRAIDVGATSGPISPRELSRTGHRHLAKHLADLGLRLGSLRGPIAGPGYGDPHGGEQRLEMLRTIIDLAAAMKTPVVSTTIGIVDSAAGSTGQARLREALAMIADRADRAGVIVALETAGMNSQSLSGLLAEINCPLLAACCDSGAMLMQGEDPARVAETLPGRIRLVRTRDAVAGSAATAGYEVAQGEGNMDLERFLAALSEAAFEGDLVLTRTTGVNPAADLLRAREAFESRLL